MGTVISIALDVLLAQKGELAQSDSKLIGTLVGIGLDVLLAQPNFELAQADTKLVKSVIETALELGLEHTDLSKEDQKIIRVIAGVLIDVFMAANPEAFIAKDLLHATFKSLENVYLSQGNKKAPAKKSATKKLAKPAKKKLAKPAKKKLAKPAPKKSAKSTKSTSSSSSTQSWNGLNFAQKAKPAANNSANPTETEVESAVSSLFSSSKNKKKLSEVEEMMNIHDN